jgi:hypothetical protein
MVGEPAFASAYLTEHEPEERVHWPFEGVKLPVPLVELKVMVPVGEEPPFTVAVHVVGVAPFNDEGLQETEVAVCWI